LVRSKKMRAAIVPPRSQSPVNVDLRRRR
jgi:hypothetical protein